MEVVGWIALAFFGLIGFVMAVFAVAEFFTVQFKLFSAKIGCEIDVKKTHYAAKAQAKKERLARKRAVQDQIENKKLDIQIGKMQDKANERFGEEVFHNEPKTEQENETGEEVKDEFLNLNKMSKKQPSETVMPENKSEDKKQQAETASMRERFGVFSVDNLKKTLEDTYEDPDRQSESKEDEETEN